MKTQNMQLISNDNAQVFYNEVRYAVNVMENQNNLETEIKFSTSIQQNGKVLYSAIVVGKKLWVN